ncbi:probable receptor-like protein kinase At2g23200 [Vicia villosa]|uniref:probable receptor-like protein kinase At2g23200 n=1 Tax=Vicia villosa TaxID=3911 RepID=UPI00273C3119|nr:probable receptor-like protein kinase At2g23200 [Vicia villosa]
MAIQHSFILLTFLLQFSSLQFPSLGLYNIQDTYFINCGSDINVKENNKLYIGESNSTYPKTLFDISFTETSQSLVPSPLYQTARIFHSESSYEFTTVPNNTYMVRFHFLSFSSPTNLSTAQFNVSVPGFSLLQNFDAKNFTYSPLIKEYFVKIIRKRFKITFTPQNSSFAFVNAIELFMLPIHFISDSVVRFNYIGSTGRGLSTYSGNLLSRALETKHRLNIGAETVTRLTDNLSREWLPDDNYITTPQNATNSSFSGDIKRTANDESDGPNSNQYIAPDIIYQFAKESKNGSNGLSISWSVPVEKNIDHFIRLHFCDFSNQQPGLTTFFLYIYDTYVQNVNDNGPGISLELNDPYYYDFVVRSDGSGLLKVTVTPNVTVSLPNAFLNGLELMKVIEPSGLIPLDDLDSNSKVSSLPVVVGSVVGGLVLVSVLVFAFLWIGKIRKQRLPDNSDLLAIPAAAGAISHRRLTYGKTTQGSPLANINLGLKISLLDLQLATENFDAKRIIGKGGFGNVYKGVLKNRMNVAVKRSVSGSGQGLLEFETEIMVLSKIRHIHLVSLIGYCDESGEMILVYEYMKKGTLRENLYNTNLPSFLTWKQRLEICIGAAKGLHYLHKGVAGGIIHRDVKSTNILLDENLVAKLADFGLSKTGPIDQESYVGTCVKGTFGYLDPDYFKSLKLTEKSDVYSFGVVLLEVLCARPAIDQSCPSGQVNLVEWRLGCKDNGILEEIVDPSIKEQIDENSLRVFSETVEKCVQENGSDRPTMRDVLWNLEYSLQLQLEQHKDSSSIGLTLLQFSNIQRLLSLSTLVEVDGMSIGKVDESESAALMMLDNISCEANQGTTINSCVSP